MESLRSKVDQREKMDTETEKKKGKVSRSPDDPASARMIRTPARTIRIICPTTPEAST